MRRSSTRRVVFYGLVGALAIVCGIAPSSARAQSTWQKMKMNILQQQCQQGIQKACQALAQMKQKQGQQNGQQQNGQQQQQGQQPSQEQPQAPQQAGQERGAPRQDGSGPVRPPAGVKVEETVLAPLAPQAKFFISPHGVHVATWETSGSRAVMYYDGVPGPKFDEILGGQINSSVEAQVAFSPDGNRYAYCGRLGGEMVAMVDGKEYLRSSESNMGRFDGSSCKLGFTSNSQHVYLISDTMKSTMRGDHRTRFIFDGKDAPGSAESLRSSHDLRNISFSPDGNHYALIVSDPADENKWGLVVDGKMAPYRGSPVAWSPDSQHLYTTIEHSGPNPSTEAMLDGKVFMRADHLVLYVAPAGNMTVAVVDAAIHSPSPVKFLVVDGKKVPGTEIVHQGGAEIDQVTISPDGKHYAARFTTTQNHQYLIVDGKRAQEYQNVDHIVFTSAPVKVTYTAFSNGKPYSIIGDEESDTCFAAPSNPVIDSHGGLMIAEAGGRAATICGLTGGAPAIYLDGKTLPLAGGASGAGDLRFSPNGQHYAYGAQLPGGAPRLVIDGVVQMNSNVGGSSMPRYHYVFSPDSQHIAADSMPPNPVSEFASGLFLDGKYIPVVANSGMARLEFTADSKHIAWAQNMSGRDALGIFVDGKAVAEGQTAVPPSSKEAWWDMAPDGSLSVLVQDDRNLKRITVKPSPESTFATMGGGGGMLARTGN